MLDPAVLSPSIQHVIKALLGAVNEKFKSKCLLEIKSGGFLVRQQNKLESRRPRTKMPYKEFQQSKWCLYLRTLLLPTLMTQRHGRVPTIAGSSRKLSLRTAWRPGKRVHVLRSRRGLHAFAYHLGDEVPPRGSFCWFLTGVAGENNTVSIVRKNDDHPYACLERDVYHVCHSDVFTWAASPPPVWP